MKLLLDENLSPRLSKLLEGTYPGTVHVRDCGLNKATDGEVWEFAREQNFTIVSKDSDFQELRVVWGSPPKVILLRIPNCRVAEIVEVLWSASGRIEEFLRDELETCLVLSK